MGKFKNLQDDVFSVFASSAWEAEDIKSYPANALSVNAGSEFLRISVIPGGRGINLNSVSGVMIIDIFTSAGEGPSRVSLIADTLDSYLVGKSLSTVQGAVTQFTNSSLDLIGRDRDNTALHRSVYSIPFNYFGVS